MFVVFRIQIIVCCCWCIYKQSNNQSPIYCVLCSIPFHTSECYVQCFVFMELFEVVVDPIDRLVSCIYVAHM